jgi:hypothetical protein
VPSSATAAAGPSTAGFFAGPWIPRHFEFEPKHPYADLTDEELMQRIREIDAATVDRSRHHAAVSPWANGYAAWADADRDV